MAFVAFVPVTEVSEIADTIGSIVLGPRIADNAFTTYQVEASSANALFSGG